jgi:hypothetical protein
MEALSLVAALGLIVLGLVNLGCLIYIVIKMYQEKGILHALFGFFCCSIYPFIWGWLNAARLRIYDIMIFWTVIIIFSVIIQVVAGLMGISNEAMFQR